MKLAVKSRWWIAGGLCLPGLALFTYFVFFSADDPNGRWKSSAWITTSDGAEGEIQITHGKWDLFVESESDVILSGRVIKSGKRDFSILVIRTSGEEKFIGSIKVYGPVGLVFDEKGSLHNFAHQ